MEAEKAGVKKGISTGFAFALFNSILFGCMALGFWYVRFWVVFFSTLSSSRLSEGECFFKRFDDNTVVSMFISL